MIFFYILCNTSYSILLCYDYYYQVTDDYMKNKLKIQEELEEERSDEDLFKYTLTHSPIHSLFAQNNSDC